MSDRDPDLGVDDDADDILDDHARSLAWEHKQDVSRNAAARDLADKASDLDALRSALRRPDGHVKKSDRTGNLVITDDADNNLLVLSPEAAANLSSILSLVNHEVTDE